MALTVLNIAFPLAEVGPHAIGGAEQVVTLVDRALVAAGHRSIVVAPEGSRVAGRLLPTPRPPARLDRGAWVAAHEAHRAAIREALARWPIDLVHLHGVDFDSYLPPPGPPALVTLHLPASHYAPGALRPGRPATYLHCVSASQRALFPADTPLLADVENGVDVASFRPARRRRGYALALGRICPEKGFEAALDAASRARLPLLLCGQAYGFPEHERYFEERIRPRLGPGRRFVGPVGGDRKRRLLAGARCVVVSSLAPETCSLVALEALASGTPVVAFRRGALPDLVEDGRTGFLVDTVEEMADAMVAAARLSAATCRAEAERRFSSERTARRYLELYDALIGASSPSDRAGGPRARRLRAPATPPR
jgi:glycosyltransferase involved in cell wall biosynthesis